jgi:hypothetical protein
MPCALCSESVPAKVDLPAIPESQSQPSGQVPKVILTARSLEKVGKFPKVIPALGYRRVPRSRTPEPPPAVLVRPRGART